jgi:hypothetical protein
MFSGLYSADMKLPVPTFTPWQKQASAKVALHHGVLAETSRNQKRGIFHPKV